MAAPRVAIPPGSDEGGGVTSIQVIPLVASGVPDSDGQIPLTPLETAINYAFEVSEMRSTQPLAVDLTDGNLTLTDTQHGTRVLQFSGTPSGAVTVITSTTDNWWIVYNTSGQTVTLKGTSGDTGVTVADTKVKIFLRIGGVIVAGPST